MEPEFLVGRSVVFDDVGFLGNSADETVMVVSWEVLVDEFDGFGDFLAVGIEFEFVEVDVEHVPFSGVDGFGTNTIFGLEL